MTSCIRHRSVLVTSALNPELFLKGTELGADITLIDLEDSVPVTHKEIARRNGISFLSRREKSDRSVYALRINKIDLEEGVRDIMYLLENEVKLEVIILPKVESRYDVQIIDRLLKHVGIAEYYATIETPEGMVNICDIARASPRLKALILGSADLAEEVGSGMDWESMLFARSQIIIAASNAGIEAIDTPFFDFGDLKGLESESKRVKKLGFTGKIVIHPKQLDMINEIFSPADSEIAWARAVMEARHNSRGSICVVDGRMVGPPMVRAAMRTLNISNNDYSK